MPAKIPEAVSRMFIRVWICRRCKQKIRADSIKVQNHEIPCPRCGGRIFRAKSKEKRIAK